MKDMNCDLCNMVPVNSGKDKILYGCDTYYIVENGNSDGYTRRISLTIVKHGIITPAAEETAKAVLWDYVRNKLNISASDFFLRKTMGTYPDHFHIHAYILPHLEGPEKSPETRYYSGEIDQRIRQIKKELLEKVERAIFYIALEMDGTPVLHLRNNGKILAKEWEKIKNDLG